MSVADADLSGQPERDTPPVRREFGAEEPRHIGASLAHPLAAAARLPRSLPIERRRPSQKSRVLAAGRRGEALRAVDWAQRPAPDGGAPITRLAAIVKFLEEDGHGFHHRPIDGGQVEYVLANDAGDEARPSRAAPAEPPTAVESERLFEPAAAPPLNAALHDHEAEAG